MPNSESDTPVCSAPLRDILLGYLQAANLSPSPGADALTLDDALACYQRAVREGQVPDRAELLHGYPTLKSEIEAFFRDGTNIRKDMPCS